MPMAQPSPPPHRLYPLPNSPWDPADAKPLKDQESRLCRFPSGPFDNELESEYF